jgi:Na+/H+ antiporter NhaD/arsenite permease-like protein
MSGGKSLLHTGLLVLLTVAGFTVLCQSPAVAAEGAAAGEKLGVRLPLWTIVPFLGILLSIALFPLVAPSWWHHNFGKVSAFWATIFAVPFLIVFRGEALHEILHVYFLEYIPFIILLWALFTVSGGIYLRGTMTGTPRLNLMLFLIGTVIASWVGTTGASMILIRPVLRANSWRQHKVHTLVFFIFLISNIGGSLTPLGDPPLFLGFLLGVPFFWTLRLLPEMSFMVVLLLGLYYLLDVYYYRKEGPAPAREAEPIRVEGWHNLFLLAGIVGAVLLSGMWHASEYTVLGIHIALQDNVRDVLLVLFGFLSLWTTREEIHQANGFSWFPIKEVAFLFAGIFMTIVPAIAILQAGEEGGLGFLLSSLSTPGHYFWITGVLSSFLDNAPTYLTFFNSLLGKFFAGVPPRESVHLLIDQQAIYLTAISIGAVFMGAMSYIGNAPNFMVRSIAEEAGIRMPSFFGYMVRFSIPILIPLFFVVTWLFL